MESRPTILFAIVLVLGGAFLTMVKDGGGSPVAVVQKAMPEPASDSVGKVLSETCTTPPLPLVSLCEKFQLPQLEALPAVSAVASGKPPVRGLGSWQSEAWVIAARGKVQFLIVTVPDPELTRLSLYFDRAIDSIQRAAESTGFFFDRHWLPWARDAAAGRYAASVTGDEPGALLFRRSGGADEYLVVFLIGESPVSGIRQRAFLKAVQYANTIARPEEFYVLGTNYSGALSSLRRSIEVAQRLFLAGRQAKFEVISGSTTVKSEMDAFRHERGLGAGKLTFSSVLQNDTFSKQRFLDYISRRWRGPVASAFLSEGQTAYGGTIAQEILDSAAVQMSSAGGKMARDNISSNPLPSQEVTIRFPREIARLRGAYPQPVEPAAPTGFQSEGTLKAQLNLPLSVVVEGRDAVPVFSGPQLPVVQEAVLLDIANTLQQEDIRLAGIAATDVFDSLFLAGFLRKATPSVRLYMDDADLLYTRAGAQYSLEGVLAITTYPLITQNQSWSLGLTQRDWPQRSPTSSRFELAMFNAARALLLKQAASRPTNANGATEIAAKPGAEFSDLADHRFPGEFFRQRPPLWLVTVGLNGYWPIALLNNGQSDDSQLAWSLAPSRPGRPVLDLGSPGRAWIVVFVLLVGIGGCFGAFTVLAQFPRLLNTIRRLWASKRVLLNSPLWRQFLVLPKERGATGRAYFLSAQCLALIAMLYPVSSPLWLLIWEGYTVPNEVAYISPHHWILPAAFLSLLSFLLLVAGAIAPFGTLLSMHARKGTSPEGEGPLLGNQYIHLAIATFGAFPFPLVFWWMGLSGQSDYSLFFFTYRSLDLLNGVSPATPFLLLGMGLFVMARLHARRHALSLEAPTELPELAEDFQTSGLKADTDAVALTLSNPLTSEWGPTLLLLLPAVSILFLIPWDWPQSLESWQYDVAYQITLRALFLFAAISWTRFLLTWFKLHRVLDTLNLHPLRATFSVLPSGYSHVPVFEGSGTLDSKDRLVRVSQDLRALAACPNVEPLDFLEPAELRKLERRIEIAIGKDQQALASVWKNVAHIGTELAILLEREWHTGCGTVDETIPKCGEPPASQRAYRIAEEIVAMPYLAFLGNAMLQLRNLLFYVTTSYFLGVMSALVYPIRGVQMIVWAATIGFVVLGTPVVIALVQMERDEILRRLTRGKGEPGTFRLLKRLAVFGALPILAMIGSYFPGIGHYMLNWLEPALKAL